MFHADKSCLNNTHPLSMFPMLMTWLVSVNASAWLKFLLLLNMLDMFVTLDVLNVMAAVLLFVVCPLLNKLQPANMANMDVTLLVSEKMSS